MELKQILRYAMIGLQVTQENIQKDINKSIESIQFLRSMIDLANEEYLTGIKRELVNQYSIKNDATHYSNILQGYIDFVNGLLTASNPTSDRED
jgi:hypothetical protein